MTLKSNSNGVEAHSTRTREETNKEKPHRCIFVEQFHNSQDPEEPEITHINARDWQFSNCGAKANHNVQPFPSVTKVMASQRTYFDDCLEPVQHKEDSILRLVKFREAIG